MKKQLSLGVVTSPLSTCIVKLIIAQRALELNMKYTYLGGQRIRNNPTDDVSDKAWKWSDGENWDYSTWLTGHPSSGVAEDFVHLHPDMV